MNVPPTLDMLIAEIKRSASTDVEFAQRVALVCSVLAEKKNDPIAAIRAVFQIH